MSEWPRPRVSVFRRRDRPARSPWKASCAASGGAWNWESRPGEFIRGKELRARAQLGINQDLAVLVMSRPLRESLEKKAFQIYTNPPADLGGSEPAGGKCAGWPCSTNWPGTACPKNSATLQRVER